MPSSTDIRLPRSHVPVFPDRCVFCGQDQPDATATLFADVFDASTLLLHPGPMHIVQVPACSWCAPRLHRQQLFSWLLIVTTMIAVGIVLWPLFKMVHHIIFMYLVAAASVVCLLPWAVWQVFFPPRFDVLAYSDSVVYQFLDAEYAAEFAALNNQ